MLIIGTTPKPLSIYIGGTFDKTATWKAGGIPVNLTGYTPTMDIRPSVGAANLIHSLTLGDGITIADPTTGVMQLNIDADVTATFDPQRAVFDMKLITPSGKVNYLFQGVMNITQMVTT